MHLHVKMQSKKAPMERLKSPLKWRDCKPGSGSPRVSHPRCRSSYFRQRFAACSRFSYSLHWPFGVYCWKQPTSSVLSGLTLILFHNICIFSTAPYPQSAHLHQTQLPCRIALWFSREAGKKSSYRFKGQRVKYN